jgi:hypothetical protein
VNGDCAQGVVYDLRNASDEREAATASGRVRSTGFVTVGDELAQRSPGLCSATLQRQFIVDRELHAAQAGGVDDNRLEMSGLKLAPSSHDDMDMWVPGVAVNRGYPWWRATCIAPKLLHCGACQCL